MKNVFAFFSTGSENRTIDAFANFALNGNLMNLVRGGDGETLPIGSQLPGVFEDPDEN